MLFKSSRSKNRTRGTQAMYLNKTVICVLTMLPILSTSAVDGEGEIKYGKYATDSGGYYYEIGGSEVTEPSYGAGKRQALRLQANAALDYSCGKFNAFDNISQIMEDLKNGVDQMGNTLAYGISNAVNALPMYLLYEADPVMAQMITNARFSAEEAFKLSMQSCEQIEQSVLSGNGYGEWIKFNIKEGLNKHTQAGKTATQAVKAAQTEGTCPDGITWVGGINAGGSGNKPINIESDVTIAGFNILRDERNLASLDNTPKKQRKGLFADWVNPIEAKNWLQEAIGQTEITFCGGFDMNEDSQTNYKTAPGKGLMPTYERLNATYAELISDMVNQPQGLLPRDFKKLGNTQLSASVITSIKSLNPINRDLTIRMLASEYAMRKTIEMAINAKRLLRAGAKDVDVESAKPAAPFIKAAIDKLSVEIRELSNNAKLQQEYVFPTVNKVLQHASQQSGISSQERQSFEDQPVLLNDGAVTR